MKLKKVLSLILSICMLISLLPATVLFVEAEAPEGTIAYDFTSASRNQSAVAYVERNTGSILPAFADYPENDTDAKDQWFILGNNLNYSGSNSSHPWLRISNGGHIYTKSGTNVWPSSTVGDTTVGEGWLAFQIYVPTAGVYDLSITAGGSITSASKSADIYLGKATDTLNKAYFTSNAVVGTKKALTAGTDTNPYTNEVCSDKTNRIREGAKKFSELGVPESYLKASGISLDYAETTEVNLNSQLVAEEAGDYILLLRNNETDTRLTLGYFTLTPVEGSIPDASQDTTFVFSQASHNASSNKLETRAGVPEGSCLKYPESSTNPGDMWAYLGTNVPSSGTKSSAYFALINNTDPSYVLSGLLPYDGWLAFKVLVPKSGSYSVSGTALGRADTSKKQEMYLIPADAALSGGKPAEETFARPKSGGIYGTVALNDAGDKYVRAGALSFSELGISDNYLISTSDISAKENNVIVDIETARGVELKKGEYVLVLREADSSVTSAAKRLSIASFTLSPMIVVSVDSAAVVDETTPKLSAYVYGMDGMLVPDAEVTYTTSDTDIISINGNIITPLDRGTATITAKATVGGKVFSSEYTLPVTVPAVGAFSQVGVSVDGGYSLPAYATRRVDITLQDKYGTVIEEFTEEPSLRVWYENGDSAVDGIEENGQWYITAPSDVESIRLFAEVTYKGDTKTGTSEITVVNTDNDKHVIIDFQNQPITDVYDATLEEHGWRFVSWDISSKGTINLNLGGLTVTPRKIGKGVIEVKIPRSGYYSISIAGSANGVNSAEDVDVYFDGVYAGDYCFYKNVTSQTILPSTYRTFYIEAGTHTLTFDCQPNSLMIENPITGELVAANTASRFGQPYKSIAFFAEEGMPAISALAPAEESYEVNKGESTSLSGNVLFENGVLHEIMPALPGASQDYSLAYELIDGDDYIDLAADGTVMGKAVGTAHVKMALTDNTGESFGKTWTETVAVNVRDYSKLSGIEITGDSFVMRPGERESITLGVKAVTLGGDDFGDVVWDEITWTYDENEENVSFSENGGMLSASIGQNAEEGVYPVSIAATLDGVSYEAVADITVTHGKAGRTYYTKERVAIAQENIKKYDWAKKEKDAAIKAAEEYVALGMDGIWNLLIGEGIPRAIRISRRGDKETTYICRYCGKKVAESGYPWVINPLNKPWKISCPECKRDFPSNDFASLYELGLNARGTYDRFLALSRHHNMIYHPAEFEENRDFVCECEKPEMMDPTGTTAFFDQYGTQLTNWFKYYGYGKGYIKNDMYTDLYTEGKELNGIDPYRYNGDINADGMPDREVYNLVGGYDDVKSGMLWCVDDGWGYAPGNAYAAGNTVSDLWTFIAHYSHNGFWFAGSNVAANALEALRLAYIYTGDEKYGQIGAVMIDRMADLYPEYSANEWVDSTGEKRNWNSLRYTFSDGSFNTGKISNDIWDCGIGNALVLAYDAFWPMYDDPEVQSFLAEKEAEYPGINEHPVTGEARLPKTSNKNIRDNIERDLVYEIYNAVLS
ncbi:MAG: hypothetical protein IJN09_06685, partial [Oscillospiraceae bacterium]|nr:hypothetical protein [Oscillospiraceae bacterium]